MTRSTHKITLKLTAKRQALLAVYCEEDLHQLRVNIRRARTLLKQNPGKKSAANLREWSKLANRTNGARDWDTLAIFAAGALHSRQWQSLRPLVEHHRGRARRKVLATLESERWDTSLDHWKKLVKRLRQGKLAAGGAGRHSRDAAHRMLRTGQRALQKNTERSWHKFRIAVKNLRYTLEGTGSEQGRSDLEALKNLCKDLQDGLGDWHDTVVHQGLLESIATDPRVAASPEVGSALASLLGIIEARRTACLQRVIATLEREGPLLAAAAGEPAGVVQERRSQEIERKFLVATDRLGPLEAGAELVQGFIAVSETAAVRVRLSGDSAWLTIKTNSAGATRAEFEYPIPAEDALQMLTVMGVGSTIRKTRYRYPYGGHVWEIDVFHDENSGLVLAEVELGSESESLAIPDWATLEVTGDKRFYNVELALRPYKKWRDG